MNENLKVVAIIQLVSILPEVLEYHNSALYFRDKKIFDKEIRYDDIHIYSTMAQGIVAYVLKWGKSIDNTMNELSMDILPDGNIANAVMTLTFDHKRLQDDVCVRLFESDIAIEKVAIDYNEESILYDRQAIMRKHLINEIISND